MADNIQLVITLRKKVPDENAGKQILTLVKERMADKPDVIVTGHITNHVDLEE